MNQHKVLAARSAFFFPPPFEKTLLKTAEICSGRGGFVVPLRPYPDPHPHGPKKAARNVTRDANFGSHQPSPVPTLISLAQQRTLRHIDVID